MVDDGDKKVIYMMRFIPSNAVVNSNNIFVFNK